MKRLLLILLPPLCLLLFSGCGSLLKQQWYDFTAYYNTFYNARQHFKAGLAADRDLRPPLNPHQLIPIHPSPSSAGASDFRIAIEKSFSILQNHPHSSYVDDALELVGISLFHLQEYFAARERFRELYQTTDDLAKRELAVIWEGRTWLELGLAADGVHYMKEMISSLDSWSPAGLAEAQTVLAQLYAHQGHLFPAASQLLTAMDNLEEGSLQARAWFHYGQVMERLNNPDQAIRAYSEIPSMESDFDLEYYSRLKEVGVWRRSGQPGEADIRLNRMLRDDRFYDRYPEMLLESAAIRVAEGDYDRAGELYREVIEECEQATPEQVALSYYHLGELHRIGHRDFLAAAHYFEAAASATVDLHWLPEGWDADRKAQDFGTYASARRALDHLERVIALAELPQPEFEQRVAELTREREESMEQEIIREGVTESVPFPSLAEPQAGLPDVLEVTTDEAEEDGFLNVHNPARLARDALRFRAQWGDRPLIDNWRRETGVSRSEVADVTRDQVDATGHELASGNIKSPGTEGSPEMAVPDIHTIPRDRAGRDSLLAARASSYFELASIFHVTLSMPDSASVYYDRSARSGGDGDVVASAIYGLADIALQESDTVRAERLAHRLINRFPQSRHADLIIQRLGLSPVHEEPAPADSPIPADPPIPTDPPSPADPPIPTEPPFPAEPQRF